VIAVYVVDELQKALKYHLRQLEENLNKVRTYEESIDDLKTRNERHKQAITEIGEHIESLEKA
jgi:peptidoglycan hydrolase CwlO-like protein